MVEGSEYQCLGIDTAEITAFELDAADNLSLWFRGCPEAVNFSKANLDELIFSKLLQLVITEFSHIHDLQVQ
jgi:hypothetical protein